MDGRLEPRCMRRFQTEVKVGRRFRRLIPGGGIWEVVSLQREVGGVPHVRLRRLDDPMEMKTLAASVLSDARQYEPADQG